MGTVSFLLPKSTKPDDARELGRACMAGGPDNMPWPTEAQVDPGRLTLRRTVDESGYLVAPWEVNGFGRLMGTSATLMERPTPYQLQVELARGKVNQLRCQAADWRSGGLQVPPELAQRVHETSLAFGHAVTQLVPEDAAQQAQAALLSGYQAAEVLVQTYVDQVFQIRCQRQPGLDTALGCRLDAVLPRADLADRFTQAFNSLCLPLTWKDVEVTQGTYNWERYDALIAWALDKGLRVTAGPLVDFSSVKLPDWLWPWERDLNKVAQFMGGYVETALRRYKGRIRRWQITNASNYATLLGLGEDELLWLTARMAELARQVEPTIELVTGIAQPWGEYMALEDRIHSPFIFADTLIRAGLNLAALDLEVVMGVGPRGSYCRDLLEFSRLLDLYALLGLPLRVTLGYPSSCARDRQADKEMTVGLGEWRSGYTPEAQSEWATLYGALALCKPFVEGVNWVHYSDAEPHQFPHCGVIDDAGQPKAALQHLGALRKAHLK
jgi:hypothetical protein